MALRWTIKNSTGTVTKAVVSKLTYNGQYKGDRYLDVTVKSPCPIDFAVGDTLEYRGETFTLDIIPTAKRKATSYKSGDAVVYENMRFRSIIRELQHVQFTDLVLPDNHIHYTMLGNFSFYASKISDFGDRLQACLNEAYPVAEGQAQRWNVVCPSDIKENALKKDFEFTVDNNTSCWSALANFSNQAEVNFTVTVVEGQNTVTIGSGQSLAGGGHPFIYGRGNGLKTITRSIENEQAVITRLKAYGSERNMPYRYYNKVFGYPCINPIRVISPGPTETLFIYVDEQTASFLRTVGVFRVRMGTDDSTASIASLITTNIKVDPGNFTEAYTPNGRIQVLGIDAQAWKDKGLPVDFSGESIESIYAPKLMLPGFPTQSLQDWVDEKRVSTEEYASRLQALVDAGFTFSDDPLSPYIISPNISDYGQRDGEVIFDGSDEDWEEVFPSTQGFTVQQADTINDNGQCSIYTEGDFEEGTTDTEGVAMQRTFNIWIPKSIGFNPWKFLVDGETPYIELTSGMCQSDHGKFEIFTCEDDGSNYKLTVKRAYDSAINMFYPNSTYQVNAYGNTDSFILTGISMPDIRVTAAAVDLLFQSCDYLAENDHAKAKYIPEIDNIFMANNPGVANKVTEGMVMVFRDDELGIPETNVTISQLVITENDFGEDAVNIPKYQITLDEEVEATLMQRVESKIHEASVNYYASLTTLAQELSGKLSRTDDDTAIGRITFLMGLISRGIISAEEGISIADTWGISEKGVATLSRIVSDNFIQGEFGGTGFGIWKNDNGHSTAEFDNLIVRMKATFAELEVQKRAYSGGNIEFSPAGNKLSLVLPMNASGDVSLGEENPVAYRCCWEVTDGEDTVVNTWAVGDQARCQTFNLTVNKYYWRKVLWKDVSTFRYPENGGKEYHFVDLANAISGTYGGVSFTNGMQSDITNNAPEEGDSIVCVGCQDDTKPERKNFIELVVNGLEAPAIKHYQGINDFTFDGKLVRGDYYDATTHKYKSVTYGDAYIGDKERTSYVEYDSAQKKLKVNAELSVGSHLEDGRPVNELGVQKGNILLNSGFTGDYESREVDEDTKVTGDDIVYSEPLKYWETRGVSIVESALSQSGYVASLAAGGVLKQHLDNPLTEGHWYILSFYKRNIQSNSSSSLTVKIGSFERMILPTDKERVDITFVAQANSNEVSFTSVNGYALYIYEPQLMEGTIPSEWNKSYSDNDKSMASYFALGYLMDAIKRGRTDIIGGLIMTQLIKVGHWPNNSQQQIETGGMNGQYLDGNSPFLWGGGTFEQAIRTIAMYAQDPMYQPTDQELQEIANFVVTHGGRAILNDVILRGYIYALGGRFRGNIDADGCTFNHGTFKSIKWDLGSDEDPTDPKEIWMSASDGKLVVYGYGDQNLPIIELVRGTDFHGGGIIARASYTTEEYAYYTSYNPQGILYHGATSPQGGEYVIGWGGASNGAVYIYKGANILNGLTVSGNTYFDKVLNTGRDTQFVTFTQGGQAISVNSLSVLYVEVTASVLLNNNVGLILPSEGVYDGYELYVVNRTNMGNNANVTLLQTTGVEQYQDLTTISHGQTAHLFYRKKSDDTLGWVVIVDSPTIYYF